MKRYRENKKEILEKAKERYENNKENILEKQKVRNNQTCYDPKKQGECSYNALKLRKRKHPDLYEGINPSDYIIK